MSKLKIAIIGGGYTGLTTAYRLSQAGHEVTIFEAAPELGGLAAGFEIGGTSIEKTYHHIFRTDTDIIDLVEELGITDKLEWRESSVSLYYGGKLYPFMTPLDLLRFTPLSFFNRIRAGLVALYLQKTNSWQKFVPQTALSWMLAKAGQQVTDVIWLPLLKGKFDRYHDKVSMAWLWARIHTRGNSKAPGEVKEKLGYFNGGFQEVVKALVNSLEAASVEIKTGTMVSSVNSENKKVNLTIGEETHQFDRVVATVPSHIFAKLIHSDPAATPNYLEKLTSVDYLGAVVAVFTSSQDISKYYWHNINDLSSPFLVFINHTKLVEKERYGNQYVYYIGSYVPHDHRYFTMTEQEIYDLWFSHLHKIFPEFDRSQVKDEYMFRLKNAQHIVTTNYPDKIPDYKTPLEGVYLSNFSQIFPEDRGTNFAVREGNKISDMILNSI